jgi:DNA/RNA-binding protein KIN17
MPRAEVGSTKHLSNQLKSKGLQRLRWYCQACSRQLRDANAFKMHTQSESHVRQMILVGEDPKKYINEFSEQFIKDFLQLLKTGHGEKQIHINKFYQEYIGNKEHIHMNATKWPSLTEFAKHLGREGICRVEETDKGIHISWIDNSPEALRRQEALRRKEAQDQGDEAFEQRLIRDQIRRAQASEKREKDDEKDEAKERGLQRQEGEKVSLSFGAKPAAKQDKPASDSTKPSSEPQAEKDGESPAPAAESGETEEAKAKPAGFAMKLSAKPQTKNVFAQSKKNTLSSGSKKNAFEQPKKMSEVERVMREDMERKRSRGSVGFGMPPAKKQKN